MNAILETLTYTKARETLAATMRRVCKDHVPVVITQKDENTVVMLSQDDFDSMEETSYLLKSPRNARRLLRSIREAQAGRVLKGKKLAE